MKKFCLTKYFLLYHLYKFYFREFRNSLGARCKNFADDPPNDDITEEEVVTLVAGKKPLLGKAWKVKDSGDIVRYRCYSYGIEYKIGDPVFIESQRPEQPFHICLIQVSLKHNFI